MEVAKIFSEGDTQLVELPKNFRFREEEIFINRVGDAILLLPKEKTLAGIMSELDLFTDDFMSEGRKDLPPEVREIS